MSKINKKPETKPAPKPATKPGSKPETKPAPKPATKPASKPETKGVIKTKTGVTFQPGRDDGEEDAPAKTSKTSAPKAEKGAGRASVNEVKLKLVPDKNTARVGSAKHEIAKAFSGAGKTIKDAIEDLEMDFKPARSKEYTKNPRTYLLGYVSHLRKTGVLVEA